MRYRNTKTGAIIDSFCVISGGDWVADKPKEVAPEPKPKAEPAKKRR